MILIALGANLPSRAGAPDATLRAALGELAGYGINILQVSPFYRTPAWPDPRDPAFVNAVARVETVLAPQELMLRLHETETAFGRQRSVRNAPRTLDLDLIDYEGLVEEGPVLPHPRSAQRNFVLIPLRDIAPDWRHPATKLGIDALIAALPEGEQTLPRW
ncbi:MAG TPA: 2-amino-4-hydroxy-6-hydroxymethyldihydropteridine diphosphokinase [Rhizomicrobium sp.]